MVPMHRCLRLIVHGLQRATAAGAVLVAVCLIAPAAQAINIERVISPRGIEAWLVQDHRVPMISLQLAFRGGSALDPKGKEGLIDFLNKLAGTL